MHKLILGLALLAFAACASVPSDGSDVGSGAGARHVDLSTYQCSAPERCDCERAALRSGATVEQARTSCR